MERGPPTNNLSNNMKCPLLLGYIAARVLLGQTNAQLAAAPRRLLRTSSNTTDYSNSGMKSYMPMMMSMNGGKLGEIGGELAYMMGGSSKSSKKIGKSGKSTIEPLPTPSPTTTTVSPTVSELPHNYTKSR